HWGMAPSCAFVGETTLSGERQLKDYELRERLSELERLFFFRAEDGIRDRTVTGVQTCALPISPSRADRLQSLFAKVQVLETVRNAQGDVRMRWSARPQRAYQLMTTTDLASGKWTPVGEIGRASCRENGDERQVVFYF